MNNTETEFLQDDFELVGADKIVHHDETFAGQSYWHDILVRFTGNKGAVVGLIFILLIIFMAVSYSPFCALFKARLKIVVAL